MEELGKENIRVRKYFYPLTKDMECYKGKYTNDTKVAEYMSSHVLALPIYEEMTIEDVDRVCLAIRRALGE